MPRTQKGSTSGSGKKGKPKPQRPKDLCGDNSDLPISVDWRDEDWRQKAVKGKQVITSTIKDQGKLNTCVVNSVSTLVETACNVKYFEKSAYPVTLSVQELIDSVPPDNVRTLEMRTLKKVFKWIENEKLCLEEHYPYNNNGKPHMNANTKTHGHRAKAKSIMHDHVEQYSVMETKMLRLVTKKPIVGVIKQLMDLHTWDGKTVLQGTIVNVNNDEKAENQIWDPMHAVLIVGYGTDPDTNTHYWLVRNSWGDEWGDAGYGKIARRCSRPDGMTLLDRIGVVEGSED